MSDRVYVVEISTNRKNNKSYEPNTEAIIGVAVNLDVTRRLVWHDAQERGLDLVQEIKESDGTITVGAAYRDDDGIAYYILSPRKLWKE